VGAEGVGPLGDALKDDVSGGSVGGMEMHSQVGEVLPVLSLLVPEVSDFGVSRTHKGTSFALAAHSKRQPSCVGERWISKERLSKHFHLACWIFLGQAWSYVDPCPQDVLPHGAGRPF